MRLTFCGGAGSVTGANYLLEIWSEQPEETKKTVRSKNKTGKPFRILVDCGLQQGASFCGDENYQPFPYDPRGIDFVLITHSHMDHIGRLPKLYKDGFRGKVLGTRPTRDLTYLMLQDFEGLLEEKKKHLFGASDVEGVMAIFEGVDYGEKIELGEGVFCRFRDAGHILGSAIIEIFAKGKIIVFSGDLGNPATPLLKPMETIKEADYVIMESTYGDRNHEDVEKRKDLLEDAVEEIITKRGVLMIPAFALERTQELLAELNELAEHKRFPLTAVFVDSPLAIQATEIYQKYSDYYSKEAADLLKAGDNPFRFPGLKFAVTKEESKKINDIPAPKVVLAGSGMSNGGRILHHEIRYLPDPNSILLIVAYQSQGSLGRRILDGTKEVRIFGEQVPVRAKVEVINGYSAHADQTTLINWVRGIENPVKKVFAVQGEEGPAAALVQKIRDDLAIEAVVPKPGETFEL